MNLLIHCVEKSAQLEYTIVSSNGILAGCFRLFKLSKSIMATIQPFAVNSNNVELQIKGTSVRAG
jgi:hypothetical protein